MQFIWLVDSRSFSESDSGFTQLEFNPLECKYIYVLFTSICSTFGGVNNSEFHKSINKLIKSPCRILESPKLRTFAIPRMLDFKDPTCFWIASPCTAGCRLQHIGFSQRNFLITGTFDKVYRGIVEIP